MSNKAATNFTKYDHRNLLLEVNDPDPQTGIVKYKYDDQGNRISKIGSGLNEYYLRDHTGREVEIYNNGGKTLILSNVIFFGSWNFYFR